MNERRIGQKPHRSAPRLPARVRWTLRGLVILPLLSLATASGFYFVSVYRLIRANLVPVAEAELTRQIGHEVKIGAADFSRRGALVLSDVAVSNEATFAAGNGEATLRAKRLTVDYNLHSLIFDSGNAAHAIGDITLDQPALLVERFSTGFNFSDFFKPKTKQINKPFVGRIFIHRGLLRFRDFDAPDRGKRPALNTLANVEGAIDLSSERSVYFTVRGTGNRTRFQSLAVSGDVSRTVAGRYRGHVIVADADAAYWTDYFKAFPQARVIAGRADADVTVAKLTSKPAPGLPLDLSGHIVIRRASVAVTDKKVVALPLENVTGTAAFTGAGVTFETSLSLAGQPLTATGTVFDFAHAQLAVTANSDRLDPVRISRGLTFLKLPPGFQVSPGPVTAAFTGAATNPTITINGILPAVTYAGNRATAVTASALYANHVLSVTSATFRLNGTGLAALRATVDLTKAHPTVLLAGTARRVDLAALRLPAGVNANMFNLGGVVDTQFLADNLGRPLTVVANVAASRLRVRRTTLRSVTGRVAWTQGQAVTITQAVLRDALGTAAVSGTLPAGARAGRWDLTVRTAGLNLAGLLGPYTKMAVSGRADFDGKILGPASAPQAMGTVRLIEPHFGRYSADLIGGEVAASMEGVRLDNVTLSRFPTSALVSGTVSDFSSANPRLALRIALSQGDVQDFLHLAEQASAAPKSALTASLPNLTGAADGSFQITGRLNSLAAAGHARVRDATVGGYRLDEASADLSYGGGALRVRNAVVKSGTATLTASGLRTDQGLIHADFAANGLNLDRLHHLLDPYADVEGLVSVQGHLDGTPQAPHIQLDSLDIPNLVVDGQSFQPLTLAGRYDDGVLTQTGLPWRFLVAIPRDYAAEAAGLVEYRIDGLQLTLPTPMHPKRAPSLRLLATIPASAPERLSHVFATVRGTPWGRTVVGQAFLARLAGLPQPINGVFALPKIALSGPLNALSAQADLSANTLTLGETTIADLSASLVYGAGVKPSGHLSASARDLRAGGVPIGTATTDINYQNRIITVNQLHAASERAFLTASGTANLDGDIAANLDASDIPLALLQSLYPASAPYLRLLPREISALSVNASGPTRSPNLLGSINLSNPDTTAAGAVPTFALDRVRSGAITLASAVPDGPKVLTVNDLAAFKNGRLVATLSGTLPNPSGFLTPHAAEQTAAALPDQDLHADLKVQDLSALALLSPNLVDAKKTAGQIAASVNFGVGGLSGLVTVTDAALGLTNFETALNKINGIVVVADNKAVIQSFGGSSTKGGTFALSGQGGLSTDGQVNLKLTTKDLAVDEGGKQSVLYEKFSSSLKAKINGALTLVGPWLSPLLATATGAPLVISDATATLPSASNTPAAPSGPPRFDPRFDVAVRLGTSRSKTVSVRSSLLRADAHGEVRLTGRLSEPRLHAGLAVVRGQFILPPSTLLKIIKPAGGDENSVQVDYPVTGADGLPGLNTHIDLTAQATVSVAPNSLAQYRSVASGGIGEAAPQGGGGFGSSQFGSSSHRYVITAHIHGLLNDPDPAKLALDLESRPGDLSRSQMLAALVPAGSLLGIVGGGSGGQSELENQFKTALSQVVIPSILSPITESIGAALNVDFSVDYDAFGARGTLIKEIGPRLEVTVSRAFGSRGTVDQIVQPPQYQVKLGYSLNRHLQVGVSTDDQRNNTLSLDGVLRF